MIVEELKPKAVEGPNTPQCQAPTKWNQERSASWYVRQRLAQMAEKGWDPKFCGRASSVKIDGVPLCRQHAGSLAVDELVKQARAEKLEGGE